MVGLQARDWVLEASLGEPVTGGTGSCVCDRQGAWGPPCCVLAADSFHKTAAIQQTASSNCIFKRQSIKGCLTEVGNLTGFLSMSLFRIWPLRGAFCLHVYAQREQLFMCVVKLLSICGSGQKGNGSPLLVITVYFTGSLRRYMVISLLLEQVQQHENEYVIALINPSARSLRMALIILHQPYKTGSTDSRQRLHTWHGLLFPGTVARVVTALRTPEEPGTARRVEELQGIASCHRITEWSGLEGTSVGHQVQPPAEAGSPRAGCTGPCPSGS